MESRRRSLTLAAALVFVATTGTGTGLAVAAVDDGATPARVVAEVWPVDALDAFVVTPATPADVVPATVAPIEPVPEAPAPVTPEPAPVASAETAAPIAPETTVTSGRLRVEVSAIGGASRWVTLRSSDGAVVGTPVEVTGAPITFDGLDSGDHQLFVEQRTESSGAFLSRTIVSIAGDSRVARCDHETLDCTVA